MTRSPTRLIISMTRTKRQSIEDEEWDDDPSTMVAGHILLIIILWGWQSQEGTLWTTARFYRSTIRRADTGGNDIWYTAGSHQHTTGIAAKDQDGLIREQQKSSLWQNQQHDSAVPLRNIISQTSSPFHTVWNYITTMHFIVNSSAPDQTTPRFTTTNQ
jgi:hypothetical protein